MPRTISFTIADDGTSTLEAPTGLIEALGMHALMGHAIMMRQAQVQAQQRKIEVPEMAFPSVGGNVAPFGRKA